MCTYLKNMEGYMLKDLKLKEFDSIHKMFDRAFKRVNTFQDFRTELVEGKEKSIGTKLIQEITKKQKVEDDKEIEELKQLMEIIPDEEEVAIDAIPFGSKYESTRPVEDLDLMLWGDLKTMFEPHVEDKIYMLVEKKYPLAPLTLSMMLEKKLIIDYESEMAYQLLKFIMKQLKNEINKPLAGITPRSRIRDSDDASASECLYVNFLLEIEPKKLIEALEEEGWVLAMIKELNQFERNKVWSLVPKPYGKTIIGLKWVFRNKMDEEGVVTKNKARLVAKGVSNGCEKCIFNGKILEEVYVDQPLGFERSEFLNHVCKLNKALYRMKQAPKAWYHVNPKESHLVAMKRIFRYLKGIPNLGLWLPKGSGFDLKAYLDSDYTGCNLNRKSISRGCQILGLKLSQLADYDVLYDKEFWYAAEVEEETKTITFSLLWCDEPLFFTQKEFMSAIDLPICKDLVPLPPKETIRAGLTTLGLFNKNKPTLSSTVLPEQSLIPPPREVNADDTTSKSLFRASEQPVTQPKAPTDLKTKKKRIPSSSQPKSPYKIRVILPKKQVTETQHDEVTMATVDATKSL
ncbi:retrovirus-related pol polyprotein from transposon TNT 1-94 [Tanacetum coccineum]